MKGADGTSDDVVTVTCPYCGEAVELWVDPGTAGTMVEDCTVCCRPWQVRVARGEDGRLEATVRRAQ